MCPQEHWSQPPAGAPTIISHIIARRPQPAASADACLYLVCIFATVCKRVFRGQKICALYFKICQTYFELCQTYFLFAPTWTKSAENQFSFFGTRKRTFPDIFLSLPVDVTAQKSPAPKRSKAHIICDYPAVHSGCLAARAAFSAASITSRSPGPLSLIPHK